MRPLNEMRMLVHGHQKNMMSMTLPEIIEAYPICRGLPNLPSTSFGNDPVFPFPELVEGKLSSSDHAPA